MQGELLQAELLRMPKPKVDDVAVSINAQAKVVLLGAAGVLSLAGVFHLLSIVSIESNFWQGWMMAMLAIAPTPGVVGLVLLLWALVQNGKLRQLARGEYYVCWKIDPAQWQEHCDRLRQKRSKLTPILVLCFAAAALLFAGMVYGDGDILFGSVVAHFGGLVTIGAAFGFVIDLFFRAMVGMTERLMHTHTPQVVIGPAGIYITGQFWPLTTFGQRLQSACFSQEQASELQLEFSVQAKHGVHYVTLLLPYPREDHARAESVLELLNQQV